MAVNVKSEGRKMEAFKTEVPDYTSIFNEAMKSAFGVVDHNLEIFHDLFPESATVKGFYPLNTHLCTPGAAPSEEAGVNMGWTTSFWTGILWLAYERTGEEKYKKAAEAQVDSFIERIEKKIDVDTHDLGFLYSLSCVAAYKMTGNEEAKKAAIAAADYLSTRYVESATIFQAWGDMNNPNEQGRMIIDCLMNLPLLYWTSEVTGDPIYKERAELHADKAFQYIVRENGTTYHTYFFDVATGEPKFGKTFQGYSDDSCWARGEAWGIYGFALSYHYTGDEKFLKMSTDLADYFLNRSPEDLVAYWDLDFTDGSGEEKDSSASAIAVCGLLEMAKHLPEEEQAYYKTAAYKILKALVDHYAVKDVSLSNALLLHGVYSKPGNFGVDEANLWGDYYYLEALTRATADWEMYW